MRIGIDARMMSASGIGRYIRNLISELQKIDTQNQYYIFLLEQDLETFKPTKNFQSVIANFRWYGIEEQRKLPSLLSKYKLDLVHFPHFNIPIFYRGKYVVTIHDFIHYDFKMQRATTRNPIIYELKHMVHKQVVNQAVRGSKKVITISKYVESELITRTNIKKEKIAVTYEAVDDNFIHLAKEISADSSKKVLTKYGLKPPYLLYVGNAHPHKNVEGLINAFMELRKKYQYLQLVLIGNDSPFWKKIRTNFNFKDIIYLQSLSDMELVSVYKSAQAYVFPSFSEGFGLPLLEAMASGIPIASSNKTCLPEIGGNAAVYFDPNNKEEMIKKITEVLNNQKLRKTLIEKGERRIKDFSWERMARQTLEVYEQCG